MRILHTADWHVGRTIRGRSRAAEHRDVLAEIAGIAEREQVDLVLVAGDQFDTKAPSAVSEQIVYQALLDLAATGAQVVVVAGNHDNPRRWQAVEPLAGVHNVHVASQLLPPDRGGVIDVATRGGEVARIALVPFLNQHTIVRADDLMSRDADQHTGDYAERAKRIISALTADFSPGTAGRREPRTATVNLVVGHLTVASGEPVLGGGERAAHTIFDYFVPPQAFPSSAHYVALGHLHLPHRIPGACPIWYAGSPLHLDFGEADRGAKAVLVVDVSPTAPAAVTPVELDAGMRLTTLRGTLDQVLASRDEVGDDHLRIILDASPRAGLADEVRDAFPGAVDVRVAATEDDDAPDDLAWGADELRGSPTQLFGDYLADHDAVDAELTALFRDLLDDVEGAGDDRDEAPAPVSGNGGRGSDVKGNV